MRDREEDAAEARFTAREIARPRIDALRARVIEAAREHVRASVELGRLKRHSMGYSLARGAVGASLATLASVTRALDAAEAREGSDE